MYKYSKEHEWVHNENNKVGISNYAQENLGDIVFVELPEVGKKVSKGEVIAVVESVKAASDIYSPVSGEIVAVNEKLLDAPETINSSPEEDGWLCEISFDKNDLESLMSAEDYNKFCEEAGH